MVLRLRGAARRHGKSTAAHDMAAQTMATRTSPPDPWKLGRGLRVLWGDRGPSF